MPNAMTRLVRDLIRYDEERVEGEAFQRLKVELVQVFSAPDSAYQPLDADQVIRRNVHSGQ